MNSARDTRQVALPGGLPHSEIPGSTIARISPGLFAACHVLHRLSVPRHPPDALDLRLIAARRQRSPQRTPAGRTIQTAAHRDKTRRRQTRLGKTLQNTAISHEDASSDKADAATPAAPRVRYHRTPGSQPRCRRRTMSASVTSQLSLHPSIIAPAPAPPKPATPRRGPLKTASPNVARPHRSPRQRCPMAEAPDGGGERDRTDDLLLAKQALSHLSYTPRFRLPGGRRRRQSSRTLLPDRRHLVGQGGFEPPTSRLSSARSNQLSY